MSEVADKIMEYNEASAEIFNSAVYEKALKDGLSQQKRKERVDNQKLFNSHVSNIMKLLEAYYEAGFMDGYECLGDNDYNPVINKLGDALLESQVEIYNEIKDIMSRIDDEKAKLLLEALRLKRKIKMRGIFALLPGWGDEATNDAFEEIMGEEE